MTTAINFPVEDASSLKRARMGPESSAEYRDFEFTAQSLWDPPCINHIHFGAQPHMKERVKGRSVYSLDLDAWPFQSEMKWK